MGSTWSGCLTREDVVMLLQTAAPGSSLVLIHHFQALPPLRLLPEGDPGAASKEADKPLALD